MPQPLEERRERAVAIMGAFVGLGANPRGDFPERLHLYARLCCPYDEQTWARGYVKGAYSCALVGCAYERALGLEHPPLYEPYAGQVGMAVANFRYAAIRAGAWDELVRPGEKQRESPWGVPVSPGGTAPPSGGDAWIMGDDGKGGPRHVVLCSGWDAATGHVTTVEGGVPDPGGGYQVVRGAYRLEWREGELWGVPTSRPGAGRRIFGVLRLERLPDSGGG